jgi:hypothetical protein
MRILSRTCTASRTASAGVYAVTRCSNSRKEHRMSVWLIISFGPAIVAVVIAVIKRRASGDTGLHIDH